MRQLVAILVVLLSGVVAGAQTDHLQCFKVKDTQAKTPYTATLNPFEAPFTTESGCVVKVPAKVLCAAVSKTGVQPTPPGAVPGLSLGGELFACYKLKCPKNAATFTVADQFGTRSMTIGASNMLCAPAHNATAGVCESSSQPTCGGTCPTNCFCMAFGSGCSCFC